VSTPAATNATRTLVLGLGNDILADDAIGLLAVRALRPSLDDAVDVEETSVHGVALLDLLTGYDHAVLIDAVRTGTTPACPRYSPWPARWSWTSPAGSTSWPWRSPTPTRSTRP
jgi:hypothetical protein